MNAIPTANCVLNSILIQSPLAHIGLGSTEPKQAAEKVANFVIPSGAGNLSSV